MLTKTIEMGRVLVAHISNAISDDTIIEVHYSAEQSACTDVKFAPIRRNGKVLTLSPANTPLVLELAGTYRFEPVTDDETVQVQLAVIENIVHKGDVMSATAYHVGLGVTNV